MDLKFMPKSSKGHKFTLCILCILCKGIYVILFYVNEVTHYLITVPIHQSTLEEIGDALIENVISKYCIPDYINNGPR